MTVDEYLKKYGIRGAKVLSLLGKMQPFQDAIKSELGQELLKDVTVQYYGLLGDIVKLDCPLEKRIEFQMLSNIIEEWSKRINKYDELQTAITDLK